MSEKAKKAKGFGPLFELFSKMVEESKKEYSQNKESSSEEKSSSLDDEAVELPQTREPIVDIFDEGDYLMVITELPGITENDIHLEIKGHLLDLKAEGKDRQYRKEILLPAEAEIASGESQYKNGILKIKLTKKTSLTRGGN